MRNGCAHTFKILYIMLNLLLSTLAMMGLTFIIGFVVAAVIKLIAVSADSMDFYSSHQIELQRLRKWRKMRVKLAELLKNDDVSDLDIPEDERENWSRGENPDLEGVRQPGYYHGVSHGASKLDLMDYYYPDTKMMYLHEEEEMMNPHNKYNNKKSSSRKK